MDKMEVLYNIFKELQNDSSRTGKEKILTREKNNDLFKQVLHFLLNPFIVTGLSTSKIYKKVQYAKTPQLSTIQDLMNYLKNHNTGTDFDICAVQNFVANSPSSELSDFIEQIATKSLRFGVSEKTVNKVYGKNFIPEFGCQLAKSYKDFQHKVKGDFFITLKLDGNRCIAIKENGVVKFFTRKGQEIDGLTQLSKDFVNFPDNTVFDGELLLANKNNLPSDELFRLTQKVIRKDGEKVDLEFYMFDFLPLAEFKNGKSKHIYIERRTMLDFMFTKFSDTTIGGLIEEVEFEFIKKLPVLYYGNDKSVISVILAEVESEGYEGLMINTADGIYQTKRVDSLLKVKTFNTVDILCVDLEEGTGKNKGKLGAIIVEYKGNRVGVGTGLSDEDREYFWNNPNEIIGRVVEIKYFEESQDEKTKLLSLRFPVFVCVREKGKEISYI